MSVTLVESVREALGEALESTPGVVLLGADLGAYGGVFRTSSGLQARFGEARVIDTPPNPHAILGLAQGLRLAGKLPVCELESDAALLAGALVAELASQTAGLGLPPLVVRVPVTDATPAAALAELAGVTVVMPTRPSDVKAALKAALSAKGIVVLCEPVALYRAHAADPAVNVEPADVLRHAREVREGEDLTLFAYGEGVSVAYDAAERLEEQGLWVGVVDLRVLSPLDLSTLTRALENSGRALLVSASDDAFARSVCARVSEAAFFSLEAPLRVVACGANSSESWLQAVLAAATATVAL